MKCYNFVLFQPGGERFKAGWLLSKDLLLYLLFRKRATSNLYFAISIPRIAVIWLLHFCGDAEENDFVPIDLANANSPSYGGVRYHPNLGTKHRRKGSNLLVWFKTFWANRFIFLNYSSVPE
jgi:hypothetical protein